MNWVKCEDGSWINLAQVTRLFIGNDLMKGWQVRASVVGPAQPFVVKSKILDQESAQLYLDNIVAKTS